MSLLVSFINQLMHSIIAIAGVKIYVIQKSKRHTLKIKKFVQDPFLHTTLETSLHLLAFSYTSHKVYNYLWNNLQCWAQNFRSSSVPLRHARIPRQHQEIFDILNLGLLLNSQRYV